MNKSILLAGAAAGLTLAAAAPAVAQTIDYGALEQVFGEPVTTSATGSPQRSTEVPVDMTIITAEDIKRSGATDLPTIVSRVAGVDFLNLGAMNADIGIRGYNQSHSPRLLVLVNGRQVYLDHYGFTVWPTIPVQLEEIRQIEVVRGPNSALFGFNAVGGVINIITYHPSLDETSFATLRGGTNDYVSGVVGHTVHLGDVVSVRLSGGAERQDEWDHPPAPPAIAIPGFGAFGGGARDDAMKVNAAVDLVARFTDKTQLRIEGSWSNVQYSEMNGNYSYSNAKDIVDSVKASLTSETPYGAITAQIYSNSLISKVGLGEPFRNRITVASVQDLFKVGADHTVRVGLEHRDNRINTTPTSGGVVQYEVWAPSAMWNWTASPQLALTLAARLDHTELGRKGPFPRGIPLGSNGFWDRDRNDLSVNAGLVYKASDVDTVRVTYARGIQSPTLLEIGGVQASLQLGPTFGIALMGNPALKPSTVSNYQVSYDRSFPQLGARGSAKLFYQTTEDLKGFYGAEGGRFAFPPTLTTFAGLAPENVGDSDMYGLELAASGGGRTGLRWSADYTYTEVDVDIDPGREPVARFVAFADTTPKHRANAAVGWADARWSADAYLRYVSGFSLYGGFLGAGGAASAVPDLRNIDLATLAGLLSGGLGGKLSPVKGYATVGARIGYQFGDDFTLAVSGQNLLEDQQRQHVGMEVERRVVVSLSKGW